MKQTLPIIKDAYQDTDPIVDDDGREQLNFPVFEVSKDKTDEGVENNGQYQK